MKILIGPYDIAGWAVAYKSGFEKTGHSVTTAVSPLKDYYNHDYDIDLDQTRDRYSFYKSVPAANWLKPIFQKISNRIGAFRYKKFIYRLIDQHDVIVTFWHPFLQDCAEYRYIHLKKKKLVRIFVGSDARYFPAFQQQFDVSNWTFPDEFSKTDINYYLTNIRLAERYADLIYSVPDQAGLQLRPYFHVQVPVPIGKIIFKHNNHQHPIVLHAPSVPYKKGTDIIEKTLNELKDEGVQFKSLSVRNLPHAELMQLLFESDIVIDEIVGHGPGSLSFEAMASGCAVATRYLENSPACFRPPVLPINAKNIKEQLRNLITNKQLRDKLIIDGRKYVEQNNTAEKITAQIIDDLQTYRAPDYYPSFLRNEYISISPGEISKINEWTDAVKNCNWYSKYVTPGERAGLVF